MTSFDTQIEKYKTLIVEKVQYTYLDKYVQRPVIDEEKLFILLCNFHEAKLSESNKDNAIITTMLVQIALDIHDTVVAVTGPNEKEAKKREKQLSVLAGDYYSGLYYSLLANTSDLDLIRVLASAIKEINEAKMELYYNAHNSLDVYIQTIRKVESLLFTRTAAYTENYAMKQLQADWLLVNRLVKEQDHLKTGGNATLFLPWAETDTDFPIRLESIIYEYTKQIRSKLNKLPKDYDDIRDHMVKKLNYKFTATPTTHGKKDE